jgi:branched-chain amino acid transport system ATP-binding protein
VLRVEGIDVFYGHVQALRGVSFEVAEGEMVCLLGANGAGKTSALRAISGLVPHTRGDVFFDGNRLNGMAPEEIARLGIAHIPENGGIFSRLTGWQNLKLGGYVGRPSTQRLNARMAEVLDAFPQLKGLLRRPAGTLSGGEQQMLAIARALISRPRLLLLDEPSHGLAPIVVKAVFTLLHDLRAAGTSLLVVEQYASIALSVVDRAYVLERGRVSLSGTAEAVRKNKHHLTGAYLGA